LIATDPIKNQDLTPLSSRVDGGAELTFAQRGGRTVLAHSRVSRADDPDPAVPLADGPATRAAHHARTGLCGGDAVRIRITVDEGRGVVITTTAATRVLSMHPGARAVQDVENRRGAWRDVEYYPAVTIPFPDSAFIQRIRVDAAQGARVGVLDTWALGRTARGEYLEFRSLSSRTALHVDGALAYLDATELHPARDPLRGAGLLAGRRYLATGFWYGANVPDEPQDGAERRRRPRRLRSVASGHRVPARARQRRAGARRPLKDVTGRVSAAWGQAPVSLDRFRTEDVG
jgi:urease accessory protein